MTEGTDSMWLRYPDAGRFLRNCVQELTSVVPQANSLAEELPVRTGSQLADWLDHIIMADGDALRSELAELGFEPEDVPAATDDSVWYHPGALFPRLVLRALATEESGAVVGGAIQVEQISSFLMTHHLAVPIEGSVLSPYRRARLWHSNGREFLAVERRGHQGFLPIARGPDWPVGILQAREAWASRRRAFADTMEGMEHTLELAGRLVSEMGTDLAAWIAFDVERSYWQRRNRAGQVQKARQESLGLGWANHDHHTFRSSRASFSLLIQILETFGFSARERFYAGAEAGWGAQVMEQPVCRLAVFADVDLSPEEVEGDFAHGHLAERDELGTVGLWCALHGESILEAGLHHLAARFQFDRLTEDLAAWGIRMMKPFSDFPYLRQAFTQGERWEVSPDRLDQLASDHRISESQRVRFSEGGAIGSHLENIQRAEGFKGFNQQTISDIIRRTDPRRR